MPAGLRARQRHRRRQRLDALAACGRTAARWSTRRTTSSSTAPRPIAALEYAKQLYETFIPGTLSWLDPNNNKAFLDGQIGLTANGISIYYAAKNSKDPKMKEMAADIDHANLPDRPGRQARPS